MVIGEPNYLLGVIRGDSVGNDTARDEQGEKIQPDRSHTGCRLMVHLSGCALRKFTARDAMVRVPTVKAFPSTKKSGLWFGAAFAGAAIENLA